MIGVVRGEVGVLLGPIGLPETRIDGGDQVVHLEVEAGPAGIPESEGALGFLANGLVLPERQVQVAWLVMAPPDPGKKAEAAERAYRRALAVNDGPFFDSFVDHNSGRFLLKQGRLQETARSTTSGAAWWSR
jgi:hypothetical protein